MENTTEINDSLLEWYNSFTFGNTTYKDGSNFVSRIKPKEVKKKITKTKNMKKRKEILLFGKYKGKDINWIIKNDHNYYIWCIENVKDFKTNYQFEGYTLSTKDTELQKKYDKFKI